MLRAVRFAVKLEFAIEPKTWASIKKHADHITGISAERIAAELEQILSHPNRSAGAQLLIDSGLAPAIFEIFEGTSASFGKTVLEHLPKAVDFPLALAAFWAGFAAKQALDECRKLKLSNEHLKHLRFLLDKRDVLLDSDMAVSKLKLLLHEPYFRDLLSLQTAIQAAKGESDQPLKQIRKRAEAFDEKDIRPKPLLDGHELMALGATPGPMVGQLAQEMYIAQLEGLIKTPLQAQTWCRDWLDRHRNS